MFRQLCLHCVGIEDLREKREEVNRQILHEEEEKAKIQKVVFNDEDTSLRKNFVRTFFTWSIITRILTTLQDLSILTDRLQKLTESLMRKTQARNEYDKTIQETEAAYMKVITTAVGYSIVSACTIDIHSHAPTCQHGPPTSFT